MPDDLCKHDMVVGTCSLCNHPGANRRPPVGEITARIEARFSSQCPGCGARIQEGDSIGFSGNREEWLCSTCCEHATPEAR